jgi:hypothetical protein
LRDLIRPAAGPALILTMLAFFGCGDRTLPGNELVDPAAANAPRSEADQKLSGALSDVINDANTKYRALSYEYDENLLTILDRVEARLAGGTAPLDPLPMPKLDEAEQLAHFKETVRRWTEKTKKDLRKEIEPLKAEVAARKPGGEPFHPDFHKKFAAAFDDFIPIEVEEAHERRNRAIHEKSKPILDEYRSSAPEAVRLHEQTLNAPPFNLPPAVTDATKP